MRAVEYIPLAITAALERLAPVKIQGVRFGGVQDAAPPSVVWHEDGEETLTGIDLDVMNQNGSVYIEIECRSATHKGASNMADSVLQQMNQDKALTHLLARYDEPDDSSQKTGEYYAHIVSVGLKNRGLRVRG